jgi:uncharacterized membrane protein (UPF0127 family)
VIFKEIGHGASRAQATSDSRGSVFFLAVLGCRPAPRVLVSTKGGREVSFKVEVADTPAKRAHGLQYRYELGDDQGMLFLFPAAAVQSFWMKNTPISLDIIFIGSDLRVVGVVRQAVPFSTASLSVSAPSQYVLEIRGGLSRLAGIEPGDSVRFEGVSVDGVRE